MRYHIILIGILGIMSPVFTNGQSISDCDTLIVKVIELMRPDSELRDYVQTSNLLRYLRAISDETCPEQGEYIDILVDSLNRLILAERDTAVFQKTRAENEAYRSARAARANANALLIMKKKQTNPSEALRLASMNYQLFPEVKTSWALFHEQLYDRSENTGYCIFTIGNDSVKYSSLRLSLNGKSFVCGTQGGELELWDLSAKRMIKSKKVSEGEISKIDFFEDKLLFSSNWKSLKIINSSDWEMFFEINLDSLLDYVILPEEKRLIVLDFSLGLKEYNLVSGTEIQSPLNDIVTMKQQDNMYTWMHKIKSSPNAEYLLAGFIFNKIEVWDLVKCKKKTQLPHENIIFDLVIANHGLSFYVGDDYGNVTEWKIPNGKRLDSITAIGNPIVKMGVSSDDSLLALAGYDKSLSVWDISDGKEIRSFLGHQDVIIDLEFFFNNKFLIALDHDGKIKIWDIYPNSGVKGIGQAPSLANDFSLKKINHIEHPISAFISAMTAGNNLRRGYSVTNEVSISPKNRYLIVSNDSILEVWDVEKNALIRSLAGHKEVINYVELVRDGLYIVSRDYGGTVIIWDLITGELIKTFPGFQYEHPTCLTASNDLEYLITAHEDQTLRLWDGINGINLRTYGRLSDEVSALTLANDNSILLAGLINSEIKILNMVDGECIGTLSGHTEKIDYLTLSKDKNFALSGSEDGTGKLWDLKRRKEIVTFSSSKGKLRTILPTENFQYLLTISSMDIFNLWEMNSGEILVSFNLEEFRGTDLSVNNIHAVVGTFEYDNPNLLIYLPWSYLDTLTESLSLPQLQALGLQFTDKDVELMDAEDRRWPIYDTHIDMEQPKDP